MEKLSIMKKQYFISALFLAYSCFNFAVESTPLYEQSKYIPQVIESSIDDDVDENNDDEGEIPKKPTVLDSWRKVVTLNLRSLNRDDAWNIGATAALAAGCYIYLFYPKKIKLAGPGAGNQPPQDPFGWLTPEELQQQREAFERYEGQQRLRQQQELQRQEEERLQAQRQLERLVQIRLEQERNRQAQAERDRKKQELEAQENATERDHWLQKRRCEVRPAVTQMDPESINDRLRQLEEEIRRWDDGDRYCRGVYHGIVCKVFDCTPCCIKFCSEIERDLILEIYAEELQQKAANKEKLKQDKKVECTLCLEDKKKNECYVMSCCNYIGCKECFIEMINTHLDEHNTKNLNCPNQKCAKKIEENDIYTITLNKKDVYERYLTITCKECLADDPNLKHCPSRDCPYAFINDENVRELINCRVCKKQYCSNCLYNHNMRITCEQAKKDRELIENPDKGQKANEKWISENTKPCPNCNVRVEKNGGCLWMQCIKCRYAFCWKCLKPHDHTFNHPCGLFE